MQVDIRAPSRGMKHIARKGVDSRKSGGSGKFRYAPRPTGGFDEYVRIDSFDVACPSDCVYWAILDRPFDLELITLLIIMPFTRDELRVELEV